MLKSNIIMLLMSSLLLTSGLNVTIDNTSPVCGKSDETLFVNYNNDLDLLKHCHTINSSIFITGGYNIDTLQPLSNLKYIEGYLVIIDSHELRNLYGLHNLIEIKGKELYSDNNSIVIRHNTDPFNSPWGLCYVDTINWSLLTVYDQWINDNGPVCSDCYNECNGCWGPGPQLCQLCKNYLSGFTCIQQCPNGTTINGSICIEHLPEPPILTSNQDTFFTILHFVHYIRTNGVMLGYELLKDGVVYINYQTNRETFNFITTEYINVSNLTPYTLYNFSMRVYNSIGYSDYSEPLIIRTNPWYPPQPATPVAKVIYCDNNLACFYNYDYIEVKINVTADTNGPIIKHELYNNKNQLVYTGNYQETINVNNIISNVNYSFMLKVYTDTNIFTASTWSNIVKIENSVGSINTDGNDNYWFTIVIPSVVGGIVLITIIAIVINKVRNKTRLRETVSRDVNEVASFENQEVFYNHYENDTNIHTNPTFSNPNMPQYTQPPAFSNPNMPQYTQPPTFPHVNIQHYTEPPTQEFKKNDNTYAVVDDNYISVMKS